MTGRARPTPASPPSPAPLDWVIRSGRYWVPHWYKAAHWLAYWDVFGRPGNSALFRGCQEFAALAHSTHQRSHSSPPVRHARLGDALMRLWPWPVCTENLIRIDCVTESPNVNGDDRALLPLPDPVRLAVQVEEPRSMTISAGSIQLPPCSTALLLLDVEGCERILLGVAHPDLLQRPLAFRLLALRQLVQHIGPSTS